MHRGKERIDKNSERSIRGKESASMGCTADVASRLEQHGPNGGRPCSGQDKP